WPTRVLLRGGRSFRAAGQAGGSSRVQASASASAPSLFFSMIRPPPTSTLFPYTTLFRSLYAVMAIAIAHAVRGDDSALALPVLRSEEHTSELQSRFDLVCRLLLEKKSKASHARHSVTLSGPECGRSREARRRHADKEQPR